MDCLNCGRTTKCCAFQPFVPNFLLGGWLDRSEWRENPHVHFLPIGAVATSAYRRLHAETDSENLNLLCGFFNRESRECGIWKFRPGECSVYYCGPISEEREELSRQAFAIESAVAQMALLEMGFSDREIAEQVGAVNGQWLPSKNFSVPELSLMYKRAWIWCQTLDSEIINSWMESK